ncbi:unnamed protein product [Parnassius apollo]|uniref:(apollo) hypothetical protein n=1 Tax=Parnassius apollo TaxID=110799 RepID=A0A8S3WKS0_PARAO|nr:unnamed protein product [Parnassius apollo]
MFKFPEVEYPIRSRLFSNQNNDLMFNETPKSKSEYVNRPSSKTSKKRKYEHKMNSKNSKVTVPPLLESTPKPLNVKDEYFFPSVDYPLDATDLWAPHYWNHIPSIQPEVKSNVKESHIIKATKEIAKIPKGTKSNAATKTNLDSVFVKTNRNNEDTNIESYKILDDRKDIKTGKESVKYEKSITKVTPSHNNCEPSSKLENENKKAGSTSIGNIFNTTTGTVKPNQCITTPYQNCQTLTTAQSTSSYISSSIENVFNELPLTAQITPSPIVETSSYCTEPIKSSMMSLTYTPLTTVPPANNEHFCDIKNQLLFNSTNAELENNSCNNSESEESVNDDAESADEMGYTIMYPEALNSPLTTSTRSPIVSIDVDNTWMYPEFDNHTLNTYSDEVEQYYILVS